MGSAELRKAIRNLILSTGTPPSPRGGLEHQPKGTEIPGPPSTIAPVKRPDSTPSGWAAVARRYLEHTNHHEGVYQIWRAIGKHRALRGKKWVSWEEFRRTVYENTAWSPLGGVPQPQGYGQD